MASTSRLALHLCYIRGYHDVVYWKLHLQALETILFEESLSSETIQGVMISLLFAASANPEASITHLGKQYGIPLTVVLLSVAHDLLVSNMVQGKQIIEMIELDIGRHTHALFAEREPVWKTDFIEEIGYTTRISYIIMIVSKAVTAHESCRETAKKRMDAMDGSHAVKKNCFP